VRRWRGTTQRSPFFRFPVKVARYSFQRTKTLLSTVVRNWQQSIKPSQNATGEALMLEHDDRGRKHPHHEGHDHHGHPDECARSVTIVVDNGEVHLHPGLYELDIVRRLAKVPDSDDLDQLVGTKLVPVPNDKPIEVRGCEIFASHPKSGGSS
jgi:hypothetical protein